MVLSGLILKEVVAVSKAKNVKNNSNNRRKKSSKEMTLRPVVKRAPFVSSLSDRCEDTMQETGEIPKFDLADQILAEQRKTTAIRRKGPGKMAKPPKKQHPAEMIARNVMPRPLLSGPGQIIAEIVARDIKELCIGNTPSVL
jgi:hypothetical protein